MPTFDTTKGTEAYVPAHGVVFAESGPGGLSTMLTLAMPGGTAQVEVTGRCSAVGAILDAALAVQR